MANVVIAIVTLVLTFMLAGYGVYTSMDASRRTQVAMSVGSALDRQAAYVQDVAEDLGRLPEAGDLDPLKFVDEDSAVARFSYVVVDGAGYVCGKVSRTDDGTREAMERVAANRPGVLVSGQCGVSGSAGDDGIAVSMRVG